MIRIRFKKLDPEAVSPSQAKYGDAGFDLTAIAMKSADGYREYDTGLAFEIPLGYVGLLFPRSSISKTGHTLANSVGVIDSGYRGPVKLRMRVTPGMPTYELGEKVGQIIILPIPEVLLIPADELNESARGEGGFGSTGV